MQGRILGRIARNTGRRKLGNAVDPLRFLDEPLHRTPTLKSLHSTPDSPNFTALQLFHSLPSYHAMNSTSLTLCHKLSQKKRALFEPFHGRPQGLVHLHEGAPERVFDVKLRSPLFVALFFFFFLFSFFFFFSTLKRVPLREIPGHDGQAVLVRVTAPRLSLYVFGP